MEVPGSGESHYYVTHRDFESESILTICSPLHPLRGSFPRRGTRKKSAAFGPQKEKSPLERGDAEGRGEDVWVRRRMSFSAYMRQDTVFLYRQFRFATVVEPTRPRFAQAPSQNLGGLKR